MIMLAHQNIICLVMNKTLEDYFFIGLILLDEFVKRTLIGVYYTWQKYDYWSHNRAVAKAARDAELNPPILPDHVNIEIPEDPS